MLFARLVGRTTVSAMASGGSPGMVVRRMCAAGRRDRRRRGEWWDG
ncbi:hypothetical protein [Azospirillum doebereinerae]